NEELYFDQVKLTGVRCMPVYYAVASGNISDPIWSTLRSGEVSTVAWDRNASMVIQSGLTVTADADVDVRNITVESGGTIDGGAFELVAHGERIVNDGTFNFSMGTLSVVTEEAMSMEGASTYQLRNLQVTAPAGMQVSGGVDVLGTLQLNEGDLDATYGSVTLRSTIDGTGRLGPVPAIADYIGKLKVERYIPGGATNWRLLGSPVAGNKVAHWQDDFYTAGYPGSQYPGFMSNGNLWPSVRWYNEPNPGANVNSGMMGVVNSNQPLSLGQGFSAWSGDNMNTTAPFVIDLNGAPNIARDPIVLPMTFTNHDLAADGWNLVSNPLPSAIDFEAIELGSDVTHAYSIYNPVNGNTAVWNGTTGTNGANGIIQSSQGFWLQAKGPSLTTTVSEDAKVDDNSGAVFGGQKSQGDPSIVRLRINSNINSFSDETLVLFNIGNPAFTNDDVPKFVFSHPQAPQIATLGEAGQLIAINAFGPYTTDIIIPMAVNVAVTGTYTITATEMQNTGLSCLRIEDLAAGTITPLNEGSAYSFTMGANDDPYVLRFRLHGSAPLVLSAHDAVCSGDASGTASVDLTGGADVTWTSASGDVLAQQTSGAGTVAIADLGAGEYSIHVVPTSGCAYMDATFDVGEPTPLQSGSNITDATCSGMADGE
ncbi:MAG TPA: hypothetical protein PK760_08935, partial [Flavobacteriales bacterium]|nr:hypothetical protein [Flavobacteriales bacterium]